MLHSLGGDTSLATEGWRGEYVSRDGLISLSLDDVEEDFHIDARPGYSSREMRTVLDVAASRGLEPMEEGECEPEILENGTVRLYLVHSVQPEPTVAHIPTQASVCKRTAYAFAVAALIIGILIPTPLRAFFPDMPTFDRQAAKPVPVRDVIPMSSKTASTE